MQSQIDSVNRATQGIDFTSLSSTISALDNAQRKVTPDLFSYLSKITDPNHASEFHMRLIKMINDFDKKLNQTEEVGVRLVTFGQSITFSVEDIGYWNPSLIRFYGQLEDGTPVELVQHVTQISFLLMALKRKNPDEPKQKIGFHMEEENDEAQK